MELDEHPLARVRRRLELDEAVVAGVLSGTSADGIDVALVRFGRAGARETLAFATRPFPAYLAEELRAVLDGRPLVARDLARLTRELGRAFGRAARSLADERAVSLDLVGSHGQTVYHHDGNEATGPATLQLGDGDFVAHASGAATVSDFRCADLAAGGEGAPLSALVDPELFAALARPVAILNLGGIANLTWLAADGPTRAFDTGPANALLDGLARDFLGLDYDPDGSRAAQGRSSADLVAELMRHPFLDRRPPKSTGRDTFGAPYVRRVAKRARALGLSAEDALASGAAFVAQSVADAIARFLPARPRELVLCGGGVHNRSLCAELARRTGVPLVSSAAHGIDPDAREALFFAHLAVRWVWGRPSTEPEVTGARRGSVLGKLSLPPVDTSERARRPIQAAFRIQGADPG